MFDLAKKHCNMGIINNRVEKHGGTDVTAFDIPLSLLLDPEELNTLLGDKYKHRALFDTKGDVATPMFPEFSGFSLKNDLEGATVTLHLGVGDYEIEFEDCNLKGIVLSPVHGGETETSFKLQCNPQNKHITKLLDAQNTELKVTIADAKVAEKRSRKQRELPLGADPQAESIDVPEAAGEPTEGDKFETSARAQVAAFKRGRKGKNGKSKTTEAAH